MRPNFLLLGIDQNDLIVKTAFILRVDELSIRILTKTDKFEMIEDNTLDGKIDTSHTPMDGWDVNARSLELRYTGLAEPLDLGSVRRGYGGGYSGIQRDYRADQRLHFNPADWQNAVGGWGYLMFPTAAAESAYDFLVVNCYDSAAFTAGFIQLAAHTNNDLLPFVSRLLEELPEESEKWFPELRMVHGRVSFVQGDRYVHLDEPVRPFDDGPYTRNWMVGRFMRFFNPDRTEFDIEEAHAVARWVEWTRTSQNMRKVQVTHSRDNMIDSVEKIHIELMGRSQQKFPNGVDGMRCDLLAAAIPIPHRTESLTASAVDALLSADALDELFSFSYADGSGRSQSVKWGFGKVKNQLNSMRYDRSKNAPVFI